MSVRMFFGSLLLLATAVSTTAIADPSPGGTEGWHMGWGMGHGPFGGFWMIVFWGAVIALIAWAASGFRRSTDRSSSSGSNMTPLEILKQRFAKGEIDQDEFEDRKRHLSK